MPLTCTIPNKKVRILSRCVHSLTKISDEFVYIQVSADGLILKCVNQACSAFANFAFGVSFFTYFKIYTTGKKENDRNNDYKILTKAIFNVFKSLSMVDRSVEKCTIEVDSSGVVFRLSCKMGLEKLFKLPIVDFESLKTFFKVGSLTNSLSCSSRLITLAMNIFPKADDEMIMVLDKDTLTFRNYTKGAYDLNTSMHTQTTLDKSEFMKFSINKNTTLMFCLREFRSILGLSDILGQELNMSFDAPHQPILIELNSDIDYSITCILSTITDDSGSLNVSYANPCAPGLAQYSSGKDNSDSLPNPKKVCRGIEDNVPLNSSIIDTDTQGDIDIIDYDPVSFHRTHNEATSRKSDTFILEDPHIPLSDPPDDDDSSIIIPTQPAKRFRLEVLANLDDDYYSEFLDGAVVLASDSAEEN